MTRFAPSSRRIAALSDEQSADLDAALVLILANHIGDIDVLREAIALAKRRMLDASSSNSNSSSSNKTFNDEVRN